MAVPNHGRCTTGTGLTAAAVAGLAASRGGVRPRRELEGEA